MEMLFRIIQDFSQRDGQIIFFQEEDKSFFYCIKVFVWEIDYWVF